MMNKQTETLKATIADLQTRASEIEADLNVRVIDGTPFLLGITIKRPAGIPGEGTVDRLLHGTWDIDKGKRIEGWKHEDAVPSDRCGLRHVSRENAEKNMAYLKAQGYEPFYLHYRDFLKARLERTREVIGHLEVALARTLANAALDEAATAKVGGAQ